MIRVLIVEDSITQREILCRIVRNSDGMAVVGEARDGVEAVAKVEELSPDVVLMDVHMEPMNGIEATRIIMRQHPTPIVIMSSTLQKRDIDLAVDAMQSGAVMAIEKPKGSALLHMSKMAPSLVRVLHEAAEAKVRSSAIKKPDYKTVGKSLWRLPAQPTRVIGIVSSAGGPATLVRILKGLPRNYPIPILLVQHISKGFEEGFASWLGRETGLPASIATDGQRLTPGVWMGPCERHITLAVGNRISLRPQQPDDIHCPGGDPLLHSIARQSGKASMGMVLTGMGDDGARGLLAIKQAGGQTIIQDEATAMVWGMPQAAKKIGAGDYELGPSEINKALRQAAGFQVEG